MSKTLQAAIIGSVVSVLLDNYFRMQRQKNGRA